ELGHGYDIQGSWDFDENTSVLKICFTCLCGEEVTYSFYLSENFYETRVEFYDYEEILPDGSTQSRQVALGVELEYEISSTVVADNGVTYSFSAYGTVDLPGFVEENDGHLEIPDDAWYVDDEGNLVLNLEDVKEIKDGVGYRYTCIVEATCSTTGEVIYEYGDGKGVVVRVLSGAYHRGIQRVTSETEGYEDLAGYDDRYEVYYCPKCGKIFVNSSDALDNKGYDDLQDVVDDMDRSDAFEEEKDGVQDQLDETMTGCMGDAGGSVSQSYEKAVEDLDDWEFEFDGGRTDPDKYLQDLMENIDAILEWATLEINKQEYATITEGQITELYENLLRSGLYDETVLRYEYDDILQCLGELVVESMDVIDEIYTAYLEKSLQDLQNLELLPGQTLSGDTSEGGTEGEITIEGTVAGLTKFVIYRELINASLDDKIADGELVAANDTLEGDLDSYVDGKKVLAVYSVMLVDTVSDTELALFEGNYTITIKLSSGLVGVEGLQILYVGDDGRVEVYDTTLSEDGQYITFTTTHLSRYVLVGGDETDLTTMIYFFAILLDVETLVALILLVVFLVIRSKNGSGKKSKKVASIAAVALLATIVPAGGITYTVLFAVGCVVMLAVDMLLVYGILNERRKASLASEETGEGDGEDTGDKTEKADK
ncbi:MAG: hypothetical protein LUD47_00910, partial [Clostridia bacterium]|nr:hypothetical protein [Clostridia bacterium]